MTDVLKQLEMLFEDAVKNYGLKGDPKELVKESLKKMQSEKIEFTYLKLDKDGCLID